MTDGTGQTARRSEHTVAALVYDGLCTFEFGIVVEIFGLSRPELPVTWYNFKVCSLQPGPVAATGGITVQAKFGLQSLAKADTIVLPGWSAVDEPPPPALLRVLRNAHKRGARLLSICSGAYVLAAAGLLSGRQATTHWRYIEHMQDTYPDVEVQPDVLYVDGGNILTSAGSASGLDLCLHVVRADYGHDIANRVARRVVLPTHREGGQAQFVQSAVQAESRSSLSPLLDDLRATLHKSHSVQDMAARMHQSERTFLRHFRRATGTTPHAWLVAQRLHLARTLLETTDMNMDELARRCGLGSAESLRHHFRRQVGVAPIHYRQSFRQSTAEV